MHPSKLVLLEFLVGRGSESLMDEVGEHVIKCPECAAVCDDLEFVPPGHLTEVQILAYLTGAETDEVEEHLLICGQCRDYTETLEQLLEKRLKPICKIL